MLTLFFYFLYWHRHAFIKDSFIRRSVVYVSLLQQIENVSAQLVFWSLGPLSKTCLLQKRLPLSAVKAMVIFHVRCDRWHPLIKNSSLSVEQQSLSLFFFPKYKNCKSLVKKSKGQDYSNKNIILCINKWARFELVLPGATQTVFPYHETCFKTLMITYAYWVYVTIIANTRNFWYKNVLQWFQHITTGIYLHFASTLTALVFFSILERLIWEVCNFFMILEGVRIQALGSEIVEKSVPPTGFCL